MTKKKLKKKLINDNVCVYYTINQVYHYEKKTAKLIEKIRRKFKKKLYNIY